MTDPDHRRNRNHSRSQTPPDEGFPQPSFSTAAHSQRVDISSEVNDDPFLDPSAVHSQHDTIHSGMVNNPFLDRAGHATGSRVVNSDPPHIHVPEVVLPSGWDAPLRNPIPVNVPPAPVLPSRGRGRGRGRGRVQPMYAINSSIFNPATDGLHRGQIAMRERESNFRNYAAEARQAEFDALSAYRNEQTAQQEALRQQQQNHAHEEELLAQQQNAHHQAQEQQAQINLQEIRAERDRRDAEAGARFLQLYRERQQGNIEEDERLAEERY